MIFLFMTMLAAVITGGCYYGLQYLLAALSSDGGNSLILPLINIEVTVSSLPQLSEFLQLLITSFVSWVIPAMAVIFLFLTLVMWLLLKIGVSGLFKKMDVASEPEQETGKRQKDPAQQRLDQERKRRMFLHMLSVLQREGRLLDFFGEDLSLYDDEQIGAAVRSVQEDCKAAMDKYIAPAPVLDQEEGDEIEIEPGFDPNAVKLTGNVAGEPPFKGVLRHRGWKAARKEVPQLADVLDSGIIVPAEVEIE
ncbi:DUF2760 domain-containing protein [Desulfocicer vacuolatum]|nr:DUF2760 domain-containing protein [Desulfocicer vacuolatum]